MIADSAESTENIFKLKELFKCHDLSHDPLKGIEYPISHLKRASVLIPLFYKNGQLHVLLTKRSSDLTHHAGYVAFPGGMRDDGDKNDIETALRESEEEIGLKPSDVEVIAVFSPSIVRPNSLVIPVIGMISPGFNPVRNEKEVALIFDLPLQRFLSDERHEVRHFKADNSQQVTFHIHHFLDTVYGEELDTWGFTAAHCIMVALIALQSDKKFVFIDDLITTKENTHLGLHVNTVLARWKSSL